MTDSAEHQNWVDPDILEYYGGQVDPANADNERRFKDFFEKDYLDPKYDYLRERLDKHIYDTDPHGRLYGKIALWSYVQYREIKDKMEVHRTEGGI